jgi:hypothetical protein
MALLSVLSRKLSYPITTGHIGLKQVDTLEASTREYLHNPNKENHKRYDI